MPRAQAQLAGATTLTDRPRAKNAQTAYARLPPGKQKNNNLNWRPARLTALF
jgi:hypothetical protein